MKIAAITNPQSAGFWFPIWHGYYGGQFGNDNLFVIAQQRYASHFTPFELGGVISIGDFFDDLDRARVASENIERLLGYYDLVVNTDTDEFLFADPGRYSCLAEYLNSTTAPYITAFGYDLIQGRNEEPLDLSRPILIEQRKFAYPITSMNKTCVTRVPMRWGRGFHFCSERPEFEHLFLLHMKRADIEMQLRWFSLMSEQSLNGEKIIEYYRPDREKIEAYHEGVLKRRIVGGYENLVRTDFNTKFLSEIEFNQQVGIYYGKHAHEHVLVELPEHFRGKL